MMRSLRSPPSRHVVFLCVPPVVELDLFGPLSVFEGASKVFSSAGLEERARSYRITVANAERSCNVPGECGVQLTAHRPCFEIDEPIDTLIVVGGTHCVRGDCDAALRSWLRDTSSRARRTGAICVGVFVLAAAGLLDGRRATTHWALASELQRRHPRVNLQTDSIWVRDGTMYTSAGVTAGIDLALAMVEEDLGSRRALEVARGLVVFLKRPGGQRQFSVPLSAQMTDDESFADLSAWIAENLHRPLPVEVLAARMAMSPRNFARQFRSETGMTPAAYVRRARIEAARSLLEQTRKGIEEIARRCGFGTDEGMRRAFVEDMGMTPGQYRAAFASTGATRQSAKAQVA